MNKHSSIKSSGSLLERASEMYDFGAALRGGSPATPVPPVVEPEQPKAEQPVVEQPKVEQPKAVQPKVEAPVAMPAAPAPVAAPVRSAMAPAPVSRTQVTISRERLAAHNFIVPDGPVTGLSEEFRIVKRQLLLAARGGKGFDPLPMASAS